MNFFQHNRTAIGIAVLGVLLVVAYYMYFGSGSTGSLLSSSPVASDQGQQLLATLGDLHSVTLDNAIFTNDVFVSLTDFGTVIPAQPVGRHNPFAPVGGASVPGVSQASGPVR